MTLDQARFIVRVMDCLTAWPNQIADDVKPERAKLDAIYEKHGRFSEGSERARAEWLLEYLEQEGR